MATAEHSWSRRCSTETIFSIQGKETDIARDTSDSEAAGSDTFQYEPVTESEEDAPVDSTDCSDSDLIKTKVVEVSVPEELVFADSERTELAPSSDSDSDSDSDFAMDFHNFWKCAQCRVANNNTLYSYCQKCHKSRQNLFPRRPQPRRKHRRAADRGTAALPRTPSQYSSAASQPLSLSQDSGVYSLPSQEEPVAAPDCKNPIQTIKRSRSESADRVSKRPKYSHSSSESESDNEVSPLAKTTSDPAITIDTGITKKVIANSVKEIERVDAKELCVICITEPKSGVFVHGRIAHICCCYRCAKKVWAKAKRCPVCNCKISNVLRAVVM